MAAYKPHARVAGRTFRRIDGVDGVPTTHKQHGWVHAWTVTDRHQPAAPFPVAAKEVPAVVAVPAMCAVVLIATLASLVALTAGQPHQVRIVIASLVLLVGFCLTLAMPALIRKSVGGDSERTNR